MRVLFLPVVVLLGTGLLLGPTACVVEQFDITASRLPAQALPRHAIASLELDFTTAPENTEVSGGPSNTHIIAQVPADWVVTSAYLGYRAIDRAEIAYWHSLPRVDAPANLHAETPSGNARPMQLLAWRNVRENSLLPIPATRPGAGRLLFIPPNYGGVPAMDGDYQRELARIKVIYGRVEEGQFIPIWPRVLPTDGLNGLPALALQGQLRTDAGETPAHAEPEPLRLGLPAGLAQAMVNPLDLYLHAPAQPELPNRYAYRLFFSPDSQMGGAPLPLAHMALYHYPAGDIAKIQLDTNKFRADGRYYLDVPVTPGAALGVILNSASSHADAWSAWRYVLAMPLLTQQEPPRQLNASERYAFDLPRTRIRGSLRLPDGQTAPVNGIELVVDFYLASAPQALLGHVRTTLPAGQNTQDYEFWLANTLDRPRFDVSAIVHCVWPNCGAYLPWQQYYTRQGGTFDAFRAELLDASHGGEFNGIDFTLRALPKLTPSVAVAGLLENWDEPYWLGRAGTELVWRRGGEATTARGGNVVWGYFHADPARFPWASVDNPEVFVKIWHDVSGRVDVGYCHVSVPEARLQTYFNDAPLSAAQTAWLSLGQRYVGIYRHSNGEYQLVHGAEGVQPPPQALPAGGELRAALHMDAPEGNLALIQRPGGQTDTTNREHVAWGLFHANPMDVTWANVDNPEVFYKFWRGADGHMDANFCFVSVPQVQVRTWVADRVTGAPQGQATDSRLNLDLRYSRHSYTVP